MTERVLCFSDRSSLRSGMQAPCVCMTADGAYTSEICPSTNEELQYMFHPMTIMADK